MVRPYLEGGRFKIQTDHDSLKLILNIADAANRVGRSRLRLFELELELVRRVGIIHQAADVLSRLKTIGADASFV